MSGRRILVLSIAMICVGIVFTLSIQRIFRRSTTEHHHENDFGCANDVHLIRSLQKENSRLEAALLQRRNECVAIVDATHTHTLAASTTVLEATEAPLPIAHDYIWLITTSFKNDGKYFPHRAVGVVRAWAHRYPRVLFVGVDTISSRTALKGLNCIESILTPSQSAPTKMKISQFYCTQAPFDAVYSARVVLLPACTGDDHSPTHTSCKAEEALLHVLDYRSDWLSERTYISVTDDDIFINTNVLDTMLAEFDPAFRSVVVSPYSSRQWQPCARLNAGWGKPQTHSTATHTFVSKHLLMRQEPWLRGRTLQRIAAAFEVLHDCAWGLLMFNLQPYFWVRMPLCDMRVQACDGHQYAIHPCYGDVEPGLTMAECARVNTYTSKEPPKANAEIVDVLHETKFFKLTNAARFFAPDDCAVENSVD